MTKPQLTTAPTSYAIHPVADDYADFTPAELTALADDIRAHGLCRAITIWRGAIVDGRHRALVCERLGIMLRYDDITNDCPTEESMRARVRSLNEHRRARTMPMSNEEKRMRIKQELTDVGKLTSCQSAGTSNLAVAKTVGVSHVTVASVRRDLEANGELVPKSAAQLRWERVAAAIEANPAKSNRDIARARAVRVAFVMQVRKDLEAGTRPQFEAVNRDRDTAAAKTKTASPGARMKIPGGKSIVAVVREGFALETEGMKLEDIAQRFGVHENNFRRARTIVLLADRTDLNAEDAATAQRALDDLTTTLQITRPYNLIRPLAERVWGTNRTRQTDKTVRKRVERAENAIAVIVEACTRGSEMELPQLSAQQVQAMLQQLTEAANALRQLRKRLMEIQP